MQEPASAAEKDKELAEKVNAMINGETPAAGGAGQIDQHGLMAMLTQAHASASPSAAESGAAAPGESTTAPSGVAADSSAGSAPAGDGTSGAGEAGADAGGNAGAGDSDEMNVEEEKKS